jgi:hypothetical protein
VNKAATCDATVSFAAVDGSLPRHRKVPKRNRDSLISVDILAFAERLELALMSAFDVKHELLPTADIISVGSSVAPV